MRASAKNHQRVTVLTDPIDYSAVLDDIDKNGCIQASTRLRLAGKVFSKISKYDSLIASYLNNKANTKGDLMQSYVSLEAVEMESLRYGENPHQKIKTLSGS